MDVNTKKSKPKEYRSNFGNQMKTTQYRTVMCTLLTRYLQSLHQNEVTALSSQKEVMYTAEDLNSVFCKLKREQKRQNRHMFT